MRTKSLSNLTRLEKERTSKLIAEEEMERIEWAGQASDEKAKGFIQKELAEQRKADQEYFYQCLDQLKFFLSKKVLYNRYLTHIFLHFCAEEDIPKKYGIEVEVNDIGIIVKIHGTRYYGAFKASGIPPYDFHACKTLAVKLGNTIAKLEGYVRTTEEGIVIPDEIDKKTYGT